MIQAFGISDVGCVRELNEDCFCLHGFTDGSDNGFCILADGMGGHNAGEVASQCAVTLVAEKLKGVLENPNDAKIPAVLTESVEEANRKIYNMSIETEQHRGMGTTIVLAFVLNKSVCIANVGDSRAYVINDNISQITCDHSIVEELVMSGTITRDEARVHPQRNVITRAVGTESVVKTDIFEYDAADGDTLILCSDGLSSMVTDEEIYNITKNNESLKQTVCNLVETAKERGGLDNITVIGIRF